MSAIEVLAGATFLALAIASARRSTRFAAVALLATAAWFAAGVLPGLLLAHRPLLLLAAFSYPDGRLRHRSSVAVVVVSCTGAIAQPVGSHPAFMVALGAAVVLEAAHLQWYQPLHGRVSGGTAAPAACALGLSLLLPAAGRLWLPGWFAGQNGLTVYSALVTAAGALLLAGAVGRAPHFETDSLIELSEATPRQTLTALRAELAQRDGPDGRPALVAATQLLEANVDLQAGLALQVRAVRESRSRIVAAAVAERQRLERILSSGAVRRLDDLADTLTSLHGGLADPQARALLTAALDEVGRSRDDLDQLSRGLHPRVLAEHGLREALGDLAARCPLPITVRVSARRYPEPVESAVWYACAEAVANLVKHSGARRATVDVDQKAGELVAEICDDGVGGAELAPGGGLAGLQDRLGTLDGSISVRPADGAGTRVLIRVPLP